MSKTYSRAGWRRGFAVGNKTLIGALTCVKSYRDYGAFTPIQAAAVASINGSQDSVQKYRQLYKRRRDELVESFHSPGPVITKPRPSLLGCAEWPPAPSYLAILASSTQHPTQT